MTYTLPLNKMYVETEMISYEIIGII